MCVCVVCVCVRARGRALAGVVNNVAEDAVGLLILDTFNATIPHTQLAPSFAFDSENSVWRRQVSVFFLVSFVFFSFPFF